MDMARALLAMVLWMVGFWLIGSFLEPWIGFAPPAGNSWFFLRDLTLILLGAATYVILDS